MSEKIVLIDGNSIVNRGFYGIPLLTDSKGRYTNGIYGFLNILFRILDEEKPKYLAVAFDLKAPTFRHKQFTEYKGTRKGMPEELKEQMPLLKEVLKSMNVEIFEKEGFEADDILGTLATVAANEGLSPVIVSGDRDLLQLASDTIKVSIAHTKGGKTLTNNYFAVDVKEEFGVTPSEFIEVKALMGDASDNIPGVPKIGKVTATKIIQMYGTVENAIANYETVSPKKASENLNEFQEQARLSLFLVRIVTDVQLDFDREVLKIEDLYNQDSQNMIRDLGFKSLLQRFQTTGEAKEVRTERKEGNQQLTLDFDGDSPMVVVETSTETEEISHIYVNTKEAFDDILPKIADEETAYIIFVDEMKFVGILLYQETLGTVYIEVDDFSAFSETMILTGLKPFFTEMKSEKVTIDLKKDLHRLRKVADIPIDSLRCEALFDVSIAAYLLNPTSNAYAYEDIARDFSVGFYPSWEEFIGKGRYKKPFFSIPQSERMDFILPQAKIIFDTKKEMIAQLKSQNQEQLFYEIEMPLLFVLADMEQEGIPIHKEALLAYQSLLDEKITEITKEIYAVSEEEFNLNSPKQLGIVLFEKLELPFGKKTKTGYSTAVEVLEKLRGYHPLIELILEYRQLAKLKSTYADGLLSVLDESTQKIYTTFNQTTTATGRLSSTEPNLQNIPTKLTLGREVRKVFVPRDENYCFLDADYSQIELRVLASMANDEMLIKAFNEGQDVHTLTASQVFHVPFDEVTSLQRRNAKAVNFGIVYGMGAFSLAQDLDITRKEAEAYIEQYFVKYPKIKAYLDGSIADAKEKGFAETLWHRRRDMKELRSSNFVQKSFGERVAMNMPIQGTAADIMKIAMINVHKALKVGGYRSRLLLQVHDELLIETHNDEKEAVAKILKENMESAATLAVSLQVDVHDGLTWFEAK
ncbi:MAG: DNA polymerase I [Bacillota bacterium]